MIRHLTVVPETADTAAAEPGLGTSIAALRREQQLPQQACCDALGCFGIPLSSAALSRWENGSNTPGCYELLALSHALGQEGRLERFAQDSDDASPSDLPEATGRAFSDFLLRQKLKESSRRRPRMVLFPVAENYASAGTGQPLDDDLFTMVSLPASEIPPRAAFAVRIAGDSMEPRYHDGQLVFIEKTSHLTDGEIGVFRSTEKATSSSTENSRSPRICPRMTFLTRTLCAARFPWSPSTRSTSPSVCCPGPRS